jgi:ATP-dependent Clp protease adaptor protein ClpS
MIVNFEVTPSIGRHPISTFEDMAMKETQDDIIEQTRESVEDKTDEPPMYRVVFYNDDFTPKAFVVEVLVHLFHKSLGEATELMWRVHRGQRGVAGVYPREIAETKVAAVIALARENGFPFKVSLEPDD